MAMSDGILIAVEPVPSPRGPGRIILLNGASSSGKSTLATALQAALDAPFLHVSSDQLVAAGILPARRERGGPFDWWHQVRPRFFAGFHRCIPALAAAGNDLIVEHIIGSQAASGLASACCRCSRWMKLTLSAEAKTRSICSPRISATKQRSVFAAIAPRTSDVTAR